MPDVLKLYIPVGNWLVQVLTRFCQANGVGNAEVSGIGSITNIWVLIHPDGTSKVANFNAGPSYEMTSLLGNVTLRPGMPRFDISGLATGRYPQIDESVSTLNCYSHLHVTFAEPNMSIAGGHLLDAQVSIGAAIVIRPMAGRGCVPGLRSEDIPADCVTDVDVSVPPYGVFSNWDHRFWYPCEAMGKESGMSIQKQMED
jgi:predicted DNA-binding protein with PD1-like motif